MDFFEYIEKSKAKNAIIGVIIKTPTDKELTLYSITLPLVDITHCIKLDKNASGQPVMRFAPLHNDITLLYRKGHIFNKIMTVKDFKAYTANLQKSMRWQAPNAGRAFEKIIFELNNQKWICDNICYTIAGDIIINGIHYQIKLAKGTI